MSHWTSPQDAMAKELKKAGIENAEFLTSVDDPSIPSYTICIQTRSNVPGDTQNVIWRHKPVGIDLIFRVISSYTKVCICIGPPAKDCPVHGDIKVVI